MVSNIINSKRYDLGREVGRGTWGTVFRATDRVTGQDDLAVKVLTPTSLARDQMNQRQLTEQRVMINESRKFAACSNVVPGNIETDENGVPFIVMPYYRRFLSDKLNDEGNRVHLGKGMNLDEVNDYLLGIANGLSEVHLKLNRSHNDLRPANIALDNLDSRALINDFGTSTVGSIAGATISPRDNMGFLQTRAPEAFALESHPNKQSDVYSFFSLGYRLLSEDGKYPFEAELNADPDFFKKIDEKSFQQIVKKKLKKVPSRYRDLLEKCSHLTTYNRLSNGAAVLSELEEVIEKQNAYNAIKVMARKAVIPLACTGLLALAIYAGDTYEPRPLTLEQTNFRSTNNGILYLENSSQAPLIFDKEDPRILKLPRVFMGGPMLTGDFEKSIARYTSDNRSVAFLVNAYNDVVVGQGSLNHGEYYSPNQLNVFKNLKPEVRNAGTQYRGGIIHQIVARSIEDAITKAETKEGHVKLEDTLAISLVGEEEINNAKKLSRSTKFVRYIEAKDQNGQYVIAKEDQQFLRQWLVQVYYESDPAKFEPAIYTSCPTNFDPERYK